MSILLANAPRPEDWIFLREHIGEVARYEPEMSWRWVQLHYGRDAWMLALSVDGEPVGFFLLQLPGDILWISALYTLPGVGEHYVDDLRGVLLRAAQGCGVRRVGFRSVRPGWGRALIRRLGLAVQERTYTEYAVTIPAAHEEVRDGRQSPEHHDQPGADPPTC